MSWFMHRLVIPIRFPTGLCAGEGRDGNFMAIARNGQGAAILRGSSIAGVLRSAWVSRKRVAKNSNTAAHWFGRASDTGVGGTVSPLVILDSLLGGSPIVRTHNQIDRHTGSPLDGGLFSIESVPPGTATNLTLVLRSIAAENVEAREFLADLLGLVKAGLAFGGSSARGIGMAVVSKSPGSARYRAFDLGTLDEHADWLDEQRMLVQGEVPATGEELKSDHSADQTLRIDVELAVPRGQDLLVGDGEGLDHAIEPQRVMVGKDEFLRLPGSAIRGVLRGWIARLAAREGFAVADSVDRAVARQGASMALAGDDIGWGFVDEKEDRQAMQKAPEKVECPVMRLFGSLYARSRVHVSDALAPCDSNRLQSRRHVSIDRVSGGASEGLLFDSQVLTSSPKAPAFKLTIVIRDVEEREADWIAKSLRAIDMGLIRVGSSKSAGRLGLVGAPTASGLFANIVAAVVPSEVQHA